MAPKKKPTENKPEETIKSKDIVMICPKCGESKRLNFYESVYPNHAITRKLPFCRSCILGFYEAYYIKYDKKPINAIYMLCRKLDIVFSINSMQKVQNIAKVSRNIVPKYILESNTFARNLSLEGFDDSDEFDMGDKKDDAFDKFVLTEDMILFWGNFEKKSDYVFLEHQYAAWEKDFTCDNISEKLIIKDLCIMDLQLANANQVNDITMANAIRKTRKDILNSGGLSPSQMKMAGNLSQETFGCKIDDMENFGPAEFFEDRELYADHDNMEYYITEFIQRPMKNIISDSRDFNTPKMDQIKLDESK